MHWFGSKRMAHNFLFMTATKFRGLVCDFLLSLNPQPSNDINYLCMTQTNVFETESIMTKIRCCKKGPGNVRMESLSVEEDINICDNFAFFFSVLIFFWWGLWEENCVCNFLPLDKSFISLPQFFRRYLSHPPPVWLSLYTRRRRSFSSRCI